MEKINSNNLHQIQIDVTSYCNSFCVSCIRNIAGGPLNPQMPLQHMTWEVWKKIVDFSKNNSVHIFSFNGNYGDLTSHPEIIEMFEYLYNEYNDISLQIHTNGGARNETFWKELAEITLKFPRSSVVFSVDGLEDTNHIYRRGVSFEKIMENARTFIAAGGNARWRMIVFDHNKHQLQEASALAREMGFISFALNRSFSTHLEAMEYKEFPATVVTAPNVDEVKKLKKSCEFEIHPPSPAASFPPLSELVELNTRCPWQVRRSMQINMLGEVWPCCYLNMKAGSSSYRFGDIIEKKKMYGENFNNLNYFSLEEIINHPFFQKDLPESFESNPLMICKEKCNL